MGIYKVAILANSIRSVKNGVSREKAQKLFDYPPTGWEEVKIFRKGVILPVAHRTLVGILRSFQAHQ